MINVDVYHTNKWDVFVGLDGVYTFKDVDSFLSCKIKVV